MLHRERVEGVVDHDVGGPHLGEGDLRAVRDQRLGVACAAQVAALSGGREIILPPPEVCAHTAAQFVANEVESHYEMAWTAALRLIEDGKTDYRS